MALNDTTKGEVYVLTQAMLWGLFPVATILLYASIGPFYTGGICSMLAAAFFAVMLTIKGRWSDLCKRSAWLDMLAASLIIGVVFYALVFTALHYTTAGNVAIIGLMEVFFSFLILSVVLREEPYTNPHAFGALLMVLGAAIILLPQASHLRIGDAIIFCASAIPPVGNMFMKRARKKVSAECIMFVRSLVGGLFLLLLAGMSEQLPSPAVLQKMIGLLLFNGVVLLGVTKWLWVESLHRITIPKAISLTSISPLFTLVFAYYVLNEPVLLEEVIGIIPLIVGIYFLTKVERKKGTPFVHPMV